MLLQKISERVSLYALDLDEEEVLTLRAEAEAFARDLTEGLSLDRDVKDMRAANEAGNY